MFLDVQEHADLQQHARKQFQGDHLLPQLPLAWRPATSFDLTNNTAHDNTITVGTQSGAFASGFSYAGRAPSTQLAPYLNGSKNLTFSRNTYYVPGLTGSF